VPQARILKERHRLSPPPWSHQLQSPTGSWPTPNGPWLHKRHPQSRRGGRSSVATNNGAGSPVPARRPVPTDLVGRCFNCLHADHVVAACKFPSRCLRCHCEGHHVRSYKRPMSPDAVGPPPRHPHPASGKQPRLTSVVVINPRAGEIALDEPRDRSSRSHSSTPPGRAGIPTSEGSPSQHSCPSPPPPPPGSPAPRNHRYRFVLRVIPRTLAIDVAKQALANALVMIVGGTRPQVSSA
jgi:hypothetical protein